MCIVSRQGLLALVSALCLVAAASARAAEGALAVGVVLPLSGALSEFGQAFKNGVEQARKSFPEITANCRIDFRDSRYDPAEAVTLVRQLASEQIRVIYNWGEPTSVAVVPLADSLDVVMFALTGDPALSRQSSHVIRFETSAKNYATALVRELNKAGYRRVGILSADNAWVNLMMAGFKEESGPDLVVADVQQFAPTDTDFGAAVEKLKAQRLDAVGVFLVSGQISYAYRALNDQNAGLPTFGTDFLDSMLEVWKAGPAMDGAFFSTNWVSPAFSREYQELFGGDARLSHAANGHDFAKFLCRDMPRKKPGFTPDEILELVEGMQGEGALGEYRYQNVDGDRHVTFPLVIRRIQGQAIVTDGE